MESNGVKVGPCGTKGVQEREMDVADIVRLLSISVKHGSCIDAITVHYERKGSIKESKRFGGYGGHTTTELPLQQHEYIKSISGYLGTYKSNMVVKSLKFHTNLGTYGPYGEEVGLPFTLPAIGGAIMGFHGSCGNYLNAIGIYVKTSSACWNKPFVGAIGVRSTLKKANQDGGTKPLVISEKVCAYYSAIY